jgi:predicted dehydrogenase
MRFGLVGTGPWATMTHGPGLAEAHDVELVGVWGRDPAKTKTLCEELGVHAYDDYESLLGDVDAVAFAVPPDVQATMAIAAAQAGKHLLLDKPVAMGADTAVELRDAATAAGVSTVVFFTDRFIERSAAWFDSVRSTGGWGGGWMRWFSALQEDDNPFGASAWRHEHGALWDLGPHAISTMSAALGPVSSVTAVGGAGDLVQLVFHHDSGVMSTAVLSQFAPPAAEGFEAAVWGEAGLEYMPPRPEDGFSRTFATAAETLVAAANGGEPSEVDVAFGTRVVELIATAQAQLDANRSA